MIIYITLKWIKQSTRKAYYNLPLHFADKLKGDTMPSFSFGNFLFGVKVDPIFSEMPTSLGTELDCLKSERRICQTQIPNKYEYKASTWLTFHHLKISYLYMCYML